MMAKKQDYPIRLEFTPDGVRPAAPRQSAAGKALTAAASNTARSLATTIPGALALATYAGMKGSGGELPAAPKKAQGAPVAAPQLTSRPRSAASVFDTIQANWLQDLASKGPINARVLQAIAPTVPAPAKPVPVDEQIMAEQYGLLGAIYGPQVAAAQQAGDLEAEVSARDEYLKRLNLLINPDVLQLPGAGLGEG